MRAHSEERTSQTAKSNRAPRTYMWGMVAILLVATALRVYALEADLPLHISLSQGAATDGAATVFAGRNMVLFRDWNPHGDVRNPAYLYPGMSWLSFLTFSLLGVGYWQANLLAVITGILAIVFLAAFAREQFGWRVALMTTLFMATSYLYLMYNRTPMAYTPLSCCMAMALYSWQRGLRNTAWFFLSGLATGFGIFFIKLLGVALLPATIIGLVLLAWRRFQADRSIAYRPLLLYSLGVILCGGLWYLFVYSPESHLLNTHFSSTIHTFAPSEGLAENLRFAIQSVLQFGVLSGLFLQTLPLFVVAYLYLLGQVLQTMTSNRRQLASGELVTLLFLLGVAATLLASANRPMRYLILMIPPMSLVAGLALDRWLKADWIHWPRAFSRFLPALAMLALAYFYYQILAAVAKTANLLRFRTGMADFRVIADGSTLFRLFGLALVLGTATTLILLWQAQRNRDRFQPLPSQRTRRWLVFAVIACSLLIDGWQYLAWAQDPRYSIAETSREIVHDLDPDATLGGPWAYVLALENELPSIRFYPFMPYDVVSTLPFTHVAAEADSIFGNGPFNDAKLYESFPSLMHRTYLLKTYAIRGYLVKVYANE